MIQDYQKSRLSKILGAVIFLLLLVFPVYLLFFQSDPKPDSPPIIVIPEQEQPISPDTIESEPVQDPTETESPAERDRTIVEQRTPERTPPPPPPPAPQIRGENFLYFPTTIESRSSRRTYTVQNAGQRPLVIRGLSITGANAQEFTYAGAGEITIAPGRSHDLEIEFLPLSTGEKSAVLKLENNDRRRSSFEVSIRGISTTEGAVKDITDDLFSEGSEFFNSRRYRAAEEVYNNVLELDPYYASAYLMRGRSRYEQGNFLAAVGDFDNVLKFRLSLPREERQRFECLSLYYAALSLSEQSLRSGSEEERRRFRIPALGRWEDFLGICGDDEKLLQNAEYWVSRLREAE